MAPYLVVPMPAPKTLEDPSDVVERAVRDVDGDPTRLLDVARYVQRERGCVDYAAAQAIGRALGKAVVEVEAVVGFYSFLSKERRGELVIRLCNDVLDRLAGFEAVAAAFEEALGIRMGETSADGLFSLEATPSIGMSDQAPAGLVNDVVLTHIDPGSVASMVKVLRRTRDPRRLIQHFGEGHNGHAAVRAMVSNNLRLAGGLLFTPEVRSGALRCALALTPAGVVREVKAARLRGRGGEGLLTGRVWERARAAAGSQKVVVCNANEGEPGAFKDRVLLTERPSRVIAGLTITGYAVGAELGLVHLRAEYAYLMEFWDLLLAARRKEGLLGKDIGRRFGLGRSFDFDVRIQLGAGAYVSGEETALCEAAEGRRGDPRNRPPEPFQVGYLGRPTVVHNVETLCCVTKILQGGVANFVSHGTPKSTGTKLLSVCGDCARPGVFEVDFGTSLRAVLHLAGADEAGAVLVGGPSGVLLGEANFDRSLCFEDLNPRGALLVFGHGRDLLEIAGWYLDFFRTESCGHCAPCRVGTKVLHRGLERIRSGRGTPEDVIALRELAEMVQRFSRCGLGQSAPQPILTTLHAFPESFANLVVPDQSGVRRAFDLDEELREGRRLMGPGMERFEAPSYVQFLNGGEA